MPKAIAYAWHLNEELAGDGGTIEDQLARIHQYFREHLMDQMRGIVDVSDDGVTYRSSALLHRPGGKRVVQLGEAGDVLIIDRMEQICHSGDQFTSTMRWLRTSGMKLHVLNFGGEPLQLESERGQWLQKVLQDVLLAFAHGALRRDTIHIDRHRGSIRAGILPLGMKREMRTGADGERTEYPVWDERMRSLMRDAVILTDQYFLAAEDIMALLNKARVRDGRTFKKWTKERVCVMTARERWYMHFATQGIEEALDVLRAVRERNKTYDKRSLQGFDRDHAWLKFDDLRTDGFPKWALEHLSASYTPNLWMMSRTGVSKDVIARIEYLRHNPAGTIFEYIAEKTGASHGELKIRCRKEVRLAELKLERMTYYGNV